MTLEARGMELERWTILSYNKSYEISLSLRNHESKQWHLEAKERHGAATEVVKDKKKAIQQQMDDHQRKREER